MVLRSRKLLGRYTHITQTTQTHPPHTFICVVRFATDTTLERWSSFIPDALRPGTLKECSRARSTRALPSANRSLHQQPPESITRRVCPSTRHTAYRIDCCGGVQSSRCGAGKWIPPCLCRRHPALGPCSLPRRWPRTRAYAAPPTVAGNHTITIRGGADRTNREGLVTLILASTPLDSSVLATMFLSASISSDI